MRWRALGTVAATALVVAAVAALAGSAGAARSQPHAATVTGASVTQSGQQVVWRVRLAAPFSPRSLRHSGRSLCLLIERRRSGAVTGQLCVLGPATGHRSPRLAYAPVSGGNAGSPTVVSATITRPNASALTASLDPSMFGDANYRSVAWQVRTALRSSACPAVGVGAGAGGCRTLYPARPAVAALHTPQLVGCEPSGPDFVYGGSTDKHEVALTFDDGPWYDTPQFLTILEHYKVPATFFEIGDQIATYGDGGAVERRMLADGDMIGDHTWNHHDVAGAGSFAAQEIGEAAKAIKTATHGFEPCLFRAPYGDVSPALEAEARRMGFTTIQWDVDPRDWALPGVSAIFHTVMSTVHNGSIVEEHDGGGNRSETLAALPLEIRALEREGYQLVTVTQLLGQRLIYR
jgi:peptidoglycan/xylan/chitin deacetylase (PgdA/CDA1 family)